MSAAASASRRFTLALIQLAVGPTKAANLAAARSKILSAASQGAQLVVLPECFNSPYGTDHFPAYAEPIPTGESCTAMAQAAKDAGVYLVAGSIPEKDGASLYNTCTVWEPSGSLIATHRKAHLFDIDIPGKITFQESKVLSAGSAVTLVPTPFATLGIGICYDVRFPELAMAMARRGANVLIYPGAFNMTTGPMHWELLARARAVDNQVWVGMCSPARDRGAGYVAFGHSMVVDPKGQVVSRVGEDEGMVLVEVDLDKVDEVREQIPVGKQRRPDLYKVVD
ncbi:omega-amidase NIT2-like protein [Catenaria anguillulae PL171]|uniref:Omega-amidase NIT2-like protein n=1 Tax=Catenaria anguillulae PL171 TaxID=765915 RepID=A0A1Y2HQE4_9FUNG|nr:omega-amidase NIT2-like protein [Catenaria anguillulae PL171]